MSSDTYVATILSKQGPVLELRVRTTGAAGLTDYACTRSFVLATLLESYPERALHAAVNAVGKRHWAFDERGVEEHIGGFLERVEFVARRNVDIDPATYDAWYRDVNAREDLSRKQAEDLMSEKHHNIELRATFTDAALLEGFEAGQVLDSAAYDIWWDDPTREQAPA